VSWGHVLNAIEALGADLLRLSGEQSQPPYSRYRSQEELERRMKAMFASQC
jgi:hypothetical protein